MNIAEYVDKINSKYKTGIATEHTFRGDLQMLIESIVPGVLATNEPKRQSCGAPDYILTKKDIPVGFIEAKDIGDSDLDGVKKTGNKEQFDRYKASLNNIFFTDYLNFHLYRDGQLVTKVSIGELTPKGIKPLSENFTSFENLLKDFCSHIGQTIKSPKKLAEMMANKARLMSEVIEKALTSDEDNEEDSTLKAQMGAFKELLIHDITPKGFADVYSQTIVYGMFSARLHDPTLPTFSRQEASELIPKSNPFLRKLFGYIAGPDIDDRIKWIVDSLVELFLACNVEEILKNYGKETKTEDPIIHFYETFLSEYDPALRKARGVWYTPHPVVNFIVRAVDDILKEEFGLPQGLADTSKTKIKVKVQANDKRFKEGIRTIEEEVHKVQILDPATGTGTFLAEVIKHIHKKFEGQQGIWSDYVEKNLLPRLNGFEVLMASYAMAHLQLDLLLTKTGFNAKKQQRFRVFLTNSLEEYNPYVGQLPFAGAIADEANEADKIKRDTPVMCVIGNPPYSVSSTNKSEWIQNLINDYKKDLNEKKTNLDDDYVKFIRYAEYYIEKNGQGVIAMITNNSFIDGVTHRQMRKHLIDTFDKVYIYDLHGFSKIKEKTPEGGKDENVFDIVQGVSILLLVKNKPTDKKHIKKIFHFDSFGTRELKYERLLNSSISSINWNILDAQSPYYFFKPKDFKSKSEYEIGFNICDLFVINGSTVKNERDKICVQFTKKEMENVVQDFKTLNESDLKLKYSLESDSRDWKIISAKNDVSKHFSASNFLQVQYRPFDYRHTYYTGNSRGFIGTPSRPRMIHFVNKSNYGLLSGRQGQVVGDIPWSMLFITNTISDTNLFYRGGVIVFPLYLYPDLTGQQELGQDLERAPNFNEKIVEQIAENLNLSFTNEKENKEDTFAPLDVLDYIYAVLHSPKYREKYREFLKIDFPKVPYPKDKETFWQFIKLGGELRQIHLLESPAVNKLITKYPVDGDNLVSKIKYQDEKVYINENQYFENVPKVAWGFNIGGYQPAQKWLKDRKDRKLEFDDILHYQKIIVALTETDRIMKEIDKIQVI